MRARSLPAVLPPPAVQQPVPIGEAEVRQLETMESGRLSESAGYGWPLVRQAIVRLLQVRWAACWLVAFIKLNGSGCCACCRRAQAAAHAGLQGGCPAILPSVFLHASDSTVTGKQAGQQKQPTCLH